MKRISILSGRVKITPEEYEPFLKGTYILTLDEALKRWEKADGLSSIYGSTKSVNDFNLKFKVYEKSQDPEKYLDPSFTKALKK
jgi:NitT/TauT family transport system substrate-binding protein